MSTEPLYYYVDAQNQAAGPIAMAGLLSLKTAGTVTDTTLIVMQGGNDWVAFSTLQPAAAPHATPGALHLPAPEAGQNEGGQPAAGATPSPQSQSTTSATAEPAWAAQLSQKIDHLCSAMDKLASALEKSRPSSPPTPAPATAALHAEKINLNPSTKPGIAALNPANPSLPRPSSTTLSPLAVPANAQKSPLPLPTLGRPATPDPAAPAKGNLFSKFLKK